MVSPELCSLCTTFDIQCFRQGTHPWRGIQAYRVVQGAASGCPFCTLLVESVELELGHEVGVTQDNGSEAWFHLRVEREGGDTNALNIVRMVVCFNDSAATDFYLLSSKTKATMIFHVVADNDTPAATSRDVLGKYVQKDDNPSKDFVQIIRGWLEACDRHPRCSQALSCTRTFNSQAVLLPTRCIRIDKDNGNGGLIICIEETDGLTGAYISVSHRWVEHQTRLCATTADNYSRRKSGKGFGELPKLFDDVFHLAAHLDIQESLRMGNYYQNSRFTIAATPSDAAEGLFSTNRGRTSGGFRIARLPYLDKSGRQQGFFYVLPFDQGLKRRYRQQISQSELLTRGWVFQEWLMSRRIICYTATETFLQCQEDVPRTEMGEPVEHLDEFSTDAAAELSLKAGWNLNKVNSEVLRIGWERTVEAYSRTKFTSPEEDRVIALAGIAREFQDALRGINKSSESLNIFVSGLWLWCIESGLLWQQVSTGPHQRLANFPTWCWPSVYTQVKWERRKSRWQPQVACRVQKVVMVRPSQLDELNSVEVGQDAASASEESDELVVISHNPDNNEPQSRAAIQQNFAVLYVWGKLHPVHVGGLFRDKKHRDVTARVSGHTQEFGRDCWRILTLPGSRETPSGWASIEHPDLQDDEALRSEGVIYALLVTLDNDVEDGFLFFGNILPWHTVHCVLLLKRVDRLLNSFERIGMGRLFGPEAQTAFGKATERGLRLL